MQYLNPEKNYTHMQLAFLDALANEARGNIKTAMKLAGYSPETRKNDVIANLKDEMVGVAEHVLTKNATLAAYGMVDILENPTMLGAKNSILASKELLDRVGVSRKEKLDISGDVGGLFILPPKKDDES